MEKVLAFVLLILVSGCATTQTASQVRERGGIEQECLDPRGCEDANRWAHATSSVGSAGACKESIGRIDMQEWAALVAQLGAKGNGIQPDGSAVACVPTACDQAKMMARIYSFLVYYYTHLPEHCAGVSGKACKATEEVYEYAEGKTFVCAKLISAHIGN